MIVIFLVAIVRIDILCKRGDLAAVLAHIVKALAKPNHTVGKLLAEHVRLIEIGAEASVSAVMPVGENLSIVACAARRNTSGNPKVSPSARPWET